MQVSEIHGTLSDSSGNGNFKIISKALAVDVTQHDEQKKKKKKKEMP